MQTVQVSAGAVCVCKVRYRTEAISWPMQAKIDISFNYLDFPEKVLATFIIRIITSTLALCTCTQNQKVLILCNKQLPQTLSGRSGYRNTT